MKRRTFLKYSTASLVLPSITSPLSANEYTTVEKQLFPTNFFSSIFGFEKEELKSIEEDITSKEIIIEKKEIVTEKEKNDIFVEKKFIEEFVSVRKKLKLIQNYVGYGNFNIISFDEMLKVANNSLQIGTLTKKELEFLESIFYYDPSDHGFYGERISHNITETINKKETIKIPYSGHYLFRGEAENTYYKMCDDIGASLILTSGIRSIVKQTKLFLDKVDSVDGNLNIASKSLAPPAYTYHTIADFDVGKKGFGHANFTSRFALTPEFIKMRKLKYIDMRYTINNKDGVRYEPWHVKVI